jgi:hypothetical protein
VEAVVTEERATILRQPRDSAGRAQAANAPPPATPTLPSTRPPQAKPSLPPPEKIIMVRVNALTPLKAGERYTISVRAIPNLLGRAGTASGSFDGPRPPAKPPVD